MRGRHFRSKGPFGNPGNAGSATDFTTGRRRSIRLVSVPIHSIANLLADRVYTPRHDGLPDGCPARAGLGSACSPGAQPGAFLLAVCPGLPVAVSGGAPAAGGGRAGAVLVCLGDQDLHRRCPAAGEPRPHSPDGVVLSRPGGRGRSADVSGGPVGRADGGRGDPSPAGVPLRPSAASAVRLSRPDADRGPDPAVQFRRGGDPTAVRRAPGGPEPDRVDIRHGLHRHVAAVAPAGPGVRDCDSHLGERVRRLLVLSGPHLRPLPGSGGTAVLPPAGEHLRGQGGAGLCPRTVRNRQVRAGERPAPEPGTQRGPVPQHLLAQHGSHPGQPDGGFHTVRCLDGDRRPDFDGNLCGVYRVAGADGGTGAASGAHLCLRCPVPGLLRSGARHRQRGPGTPRCRPPRHAAGTGRGHPFRRGLLCLSGRHAGSAGGSPHCPGSCTTSPSGPSRVR